MDTFAIINEYMKILLKHKVGYRKRYLVAYFLRDLFDPSHTTSLVHKDPDIFVSKLRK